jgi:hypothetical protein
VSYPSLAPLKFAGSLTRVGWAFNRGIAARMPHFRGFANMNAGCTHPSEQVQRARCFIGPIAGEAPALLNTELPARGPTKMNIKRTLTSLTTAVALAATTLAPMATSASAEPWRDGYRGGYGQQNRGDWNRGGDRGRHDFYAYRRHKHHDTGKYIALGIGALMLGIMASEAGRH